MLGLFLSSSFAAAPVLNDHWAVLIAGSNTYGNYRHQADVCHAYQVVVEKGIPKEQIIVMAYDDIANNRQNPFPGKIFNKPTAAGTPGIDVYANCSIDWRGKEVTPTNFVKVLTGDDSADTPVSSRTSPDNSHKCDFFSHNSTKCASTETCCCTKRCNTCAPPNYCAHYVCCSSSQICHAASHQCAAAPPPPPPSTRRVLKSTSKSKVFVNFVDHGGVGIIGFPTGQPLMHAKELMAALQKMHDTKMYGELVFYLEACESGSMFQDLPAGINVYATTASNAKESSWGTYCGSEAMVDGTSLGSCLGDLYSVKWMENSDLDTPGETLADQFSLVQTAVSKSHVMQFGDTQTVATESVNAFQGNAAAAASRTAMVRSTAMFGVRPVAADSHVDSRAAELTSAVDRFLASDAEEDATEIFELVQERLVSAARFRAIVSAVTKEDVKARPLPEPVDMDCHYAAHKAYVSACGDWTSGAMMHSATLAKLCQVTEGNTQPITAAIQSACL